MKIRDYSVSKHQTSNTTETTIARRTSTDTRLLQNSNNQSSKTTPNMASASDLTSRFYEAEWPDQGEVVVCKVTSVGDCSSYVTLLEYGHVEAMLPHSELSSRRLRSVHHHVSQGCTLCLRVTRVDPEKGYIDLSKSQVDEDKKICEHRFVRGKLVNSMIRRVAELLSMTSECALEDLCRHTSWRLDREANRQTASLDVFQQAYSDPSVLDHLELDPATLNPLLQVIAHRLAPRHIKIRADVKVTCWSYEGVDAVKRSLRAGKETSTSVLPVKVFVVAPPVYAVTCSTQTNQYAAAIVAVQQAIAAISSTITTFKGGNFSISKEPTLVSDVPGLDAVGSRAYSLVHQDNITSDYDETYVLSGLTSVCA